MRKALYNWFGDHYALVVFTNGCGFLFILGIGLISARAPGSTVINALVSALGGLMGWALGMLFAPYTEAEAAKFSAIGKTISAFISGYVISKVDRFLELTMFNKNLVDGVIVEAPVDTTWLRLALFACSGLVIMLIVLSNRTYFGVYQDAVLKARMYRRQFRRLRRLMRLTHGK